MNIIKSSTGNSLKPLLDQLVQHISAVPRRTYTTELYPYTTELYKKNYIRYQVQSKQGVIHDYLFTGDERLPRLTERLKG